MALNISLDKSSQSTFAKAVKNIKTLIKKNEELGNEDTSGSNVPTAKKVLGKNQTTKSNRRFLGRGVVFLSSIPKGFYDEQMRSYFSQFGKVTRINVVRSKITGRPKGYAFVEFLYSEVAQVVAETMNNFLMFGKILKAKYIPGDQVHRGMFANSHIRPETCPRSLAQKKMCKQINKVLTDEEVTKLARRDMKQLDRLKRQMAKHGIEFYCQVEGDASLSLPDSDNVAEVSQKLSKKKNRKRSLSTRSTSSTPEKRMSLLDDLKSVQKSHTKLDNTPILKLKKLDQSLVSSTISPDEENTLRKQSPRKGSASKVSSANKKISISKTLTITPSGRKLMRSPSVSVKKAKSPKQLLDSARKMRTPSRVQRK